MLIRAGVSLRAAVRVRVGSSVTLVRARLRGRVSVRVRFGPSIARAIVGGFFARTLDMRMAPSHLISVKIKVSE